MLLVCCEGLHSKRLSFFLQSMGRDAAQPASSAATTSTTPPPAGGTIAPSRHGAARGSIKSSGGPNSRYSALQSYDVNRVPQSEKIHTGTP